MWTVFQKTFISCCELQKYNDIFIISKAVRFPKTAFSKDEGKKMFSMKI